MAGNTLLTISEITYKAAMILKNSMRFAGNVSREYDNQFARTGAKIGNTINVRKPIRPVGRTGRVAKFDDMVETYVSLTLSKQFGVDLNYTSQDQTLSMDDFARRYLDPSINVIANEIDYDGMLLYDQVANTVGTPGTVPSDFETYLNAGALLSDEATPRDMMRCALLNPTSMAKIVSANKGLFNPQALIGDQYRTGLMGKQTGGFDWYEAQNVVTHTVGPLGGTPLVDGASQTGSTLVTKGWTSSAASRLKKGDVFTIAGVYAVNPVSRQNTGKLRWFVVTADFSSDGSGNGSVSIYPAITPPNADGTKKQFQTVTASPADSAAITVLGAANTVTPQNLTFHKNAVILGMADLERPRGAVESEVVSDPMSGISIRLVHYYDGVNDLSGARLDVLYGYVVVYPELMCRVAS